MAIGQKRQRDEDALCLRLRLWNFDLTHFTHRLIIFMLVPSSNTMDPVQVFDYNIEQLQTSSVTFFTNGAEVRRVIPLMCYRVRLLEIRR